MEKKKYSVKFLKKRKFLMVLPILVLPFITMLFWTLGGGKGNEASGQAKEAGLNKELPGANLKDNSALSKLSFYEQAERDSAKLKELMKNDPYYQGGDEQQEEGKSLLAFDPLPPHRLDKGLKVYQDPNEEKVYNKLAELNKELNTASPTTNLQKETNERYKAPHGSSGMNSNDIDRLEHMMHNMKEDGNKEDPQMKQINDVLEKIAQVQHPENTKGKQALHRSALTNEVVPVTVANNEKNISLLQSSDDSTNQKNETAFFTSSAQHKTELEQNAISAAVYETQTLVSGAIVKLRLLQNIHIHEQVVPEGQLIYGIAELNNERLNITINSIRYANAIYPVKLEVYDVDGLSGVYIPGAISRDVAKQATNNAIQSVEIMSMDRSLSAQAAGAGINAAKSLLTKKVKQVKVTIKAGYQVLLKDNQSK